MDITQLILDDHAEQRRLFAMLEQIDPADKANLAAVWKRLAAFLEVHAESEEQIFYPALLKVGRKAGAKDATRADACDAIKDHNAIRDAVAEVASRQVGSKAWFAAVAAANKANGDHMAEEEREGLTHFRQQASLDLRHKLAVEFAAWEFAHVTGVKPVDKNPARWVEQHG
ncbi:MAG: hemerythrin domain-containing protein [Sphingomonadales bacterium]|nr:hemerythrin domain-containing protein [Sphingomonadales bacterium]